MSKKIIDTSTLTSIADAIREQEGSEEPIKVEDFADRIANLVGGSGVNFYYEEMTFTALTWSKEVSITHDLGSTNIYGVIEAGTTVNTWNEITLITNNVIGLGNSYRISSMNNFAPVNENKIQLAKNNNDNNKYYFSPNRKYKCYLFGLPESED